MGKFAIRFILWAWASAAFAQTPASQPYVPIVLDQARLALLDSELRKLPMPADTYDQIKALFGRFEREAQQIAAEAASKVTTAPKAEQKKEPNE